MQSEEPTVQTTPVLPFEDNEVRFDDLIPDESGAANPPIPNQDVETDRDRLSQSALGIRHDSEKPLDGAITGVGHNSDTPLNRPIGVGHNGGPPLEDKPAWQLFKARLLRSTGLGLLLATVAPTPLNRGDAEYIASIFPWPYGKLKLKGNLPDDFQANHLNQSGAYRKVIPRDDGLAVGMYGDALTKPGTTHYAFHEALEEFWNRYRQGGDLQDVRPTNADYDQALRHALQKVGYSPEQVSYLADRAAAQRAEYKLLESDAVPEVPKKIRSGKTTLQRLQERLSEPNTSNPHQSNK